MLEYAQSACSAGIWSMLLILPHNRIVGMAFLNTQLQPVGVQSHRQLHFLTKVCRIQTYDLANNRRLPLGVLLPVDAV